MWADGTAFSGGSYRVSTFKYLLALYLVTENGSIVTDADLARGRFPDVSVQVHLTILSAGYFLTVSFILAFVLGSGGDEPP